MASLASKIRVSQLCEMFEKIYHAKGKKKNEILEKFFDDCRDLGVKLKKDNPNSDVSMFSIVRLFLVDKDKERGPYNLKESTMGLKITQIYVLGKTSVDANRILKYK